VRIPIGIACACTASVLYNAGAALQALEAREVPADHSLRPSLIARLLRRPRWLAGSALTALGWPLQAAALTLVPLTVVQPALAGGLLLLLVIGAKVLGERVGPNELAGVAGIVGGLAVLAWAAPPHSSQHAGTAVLAFALCALALPALAPYAAGPKRLHSGSLVALAAGLAYAWSGVTTKLFADGVSADLWYSALMWALATGAASALGMLSEMTALQRSPATRVCPTVFSAQVLVPVLVAPLLVGEGWGATPLSGMAIVAGLVAVAAGVVLLAASPPVAALTGATSGAVERPRAASAPRSDSTSRRSGRDGESARTTTT
jgi:drug/metabolite transporter (DMT)-like permease